MTIGLIVSIIFVVLKVLGFIQWSWLIVFLPCLIEFGLELLAFIIYVIVVVLILKKEL